MAVSKMPRVPRPTRLDNTRVSAASGILYQGRSGVMAIVRIIVNAFHQCDITRARVRACPLALFYIPLRRAVECVMLKWPRHYRRHVSHIILYIGLHVFRGEANSLSQSYSWLFVTSNIYGLLKIAYQTTRDKLHAVKMSTRRSAFNYGCLCSAWVNSI